MSPNQIFSNKTWGGKILILNYKENCFEDIYGPPNSKIISITFTSMYLVLFSFLILYLFYELWYIRIKIKPISWFVWLNGRETLMYTSSD